MESSHFTVIPGSGGRPNEASQQLASCMTSQGNRVVLSGIGGDEFTGGVPTPTPEFQNLIARAQIMTLAHQLKIWALEKRRPWFYLFFDAARGFIPRMLLSPPKHKRPAPWLNPSFVRRNRAALQGYETRVNLFGPLPSFQDNASTLNTLQRQLEYSALPSDPVYEKRYPYLDRGLIEFLSAVPREQLVRPGQRRSLMRRALIGIVPDELLNRKRKAYVVRSVMTAISAEYKNLVELTHNMESSSLGIVDSKRFHEALQKVRQNQEVPMVPLMRTIGIEIWLQKLRDCRLLSDGQQTHSQLLSFRGQLAAIKDSTLQG